MRKDPPHVLSLSQITNRINATEIAIVASATRNDMAKDELRNTTMTNQALEIP